MFGEWKAKSTDDKRLVQRRQEVVAYNGVFNQNRRQIHTIEKFKTLADLNKEEGVVDMTAAMKEAEVMSSEPQYWLFDKFSKKVNLITMTQILLKLIILKKIIKFIALTCLLFFIPTYNDPNKISRSEARDFNITSKARMINEPLNDFNC